MNLTLAVLVIPNATMIDIRAFLNNQSAAISAPIDAKESAPEALFTTLFAAAIFAGMALSTVLHLFNNKSNNKSKVLNFKKRAACPFSGDVAGNGRISLCPFAAKGTQPANKRTLIKKLKARPFAGGQVEKLSSQTLLREVDRDPTNVPTTKTFWELYQSIANEGTGLFGDCIEAEGGADSSYLKKTPKLKAMVALAETESSERYNAFCDADGYRHWIASKLEEIDANESYHGHQSLQEELNSLNRSELRLVLGACVYLRHSWHQGNPSLPPIPTTEPTNSHGSIVSEPSQLKLSVEYCAEKLGVAPFFNVYSWVFCNWKWTPNHVEGGSSCNYENICDLTKGTLAPRFYWLTGEARESEANFWRAFAYSEVMAIPLYGEVGRLMDEVYAWDKSSSTAGPSLESIDRVTKSLNVIRDVTKNITAALVSFARPELIDAQHFIQMQNTGHFAGTTAGASGFQAPWMVMLDTLLGVDHSTLSQELQDTRSDNIDEMLPEVVSILFGVVRPGAMTLRNEYIRSIQCPIQRQKVQLAFNSVTKELIMWRSSHRSRAGKYIAASTITTGRTNEDMGGDVQSTFLTEMSAIITATKATILGGGK